MEFFDPIFVFVVCINTISVLGMLAAQQWEMGYFPPRHSIIPGTNQKFLYIQDFWTMTWGDWIGIPLILNAFLHLAFKDVTNLWWSMLIGAMSAVVFAKICLGENHKPDYGFPSTGEIRFAGFLHLFYFGVGVGASAMCVWNLFTGELYGPVMWVALAGGAFYIICFIIEIKSGNFDPIKRIEVPEKNHI